LFPQLDLTGTYGRSGVFSSFGETVNQIGTERFPNYSFGATMSLPLSNRTAKNNYKSTKALIEQTLLQYKRLEQTIMKEVQNSVVQAQSSLEQIKARESAVDYAQAALDAEQKKLEQGKSTSFQVLQLQQNLTQAKSDRISALVSYNIALAQLNKNQGTTLEHRKLDVKKP